MKINTRTVVPAATSILVGSVPMLLMLSGIAEPSLYFYIISALNFIAWTSLCALFLSRKKMLSAVDSAVFNLGLPIVQGDLEEKLGSFLYESTRLYKASYAFNKPGNVSANDLGLNLRRIVELAYQQVDAQAVELALYNQSTQQWSQALVLGRPMSLASQSMLLDASNEENVVSSRGLKSRVIAQPLSFAGQVFGALRVEFLPGVEPSKTDIEVVFLLARQGALMLVDAQFTEQLLHMTKVSEESVRAKTGFLANLSHEIRGPLGIILNGVELILDGLCGPITESQRDTCEMIKSSGDHLVELVTDVLDYAKVEAGKVTAKPVVVDVGALLSDLTNVVRSQASEKGHKLVLEKVDSGLAMLCDKRHARQMIINFLTNAIKYTPNDGTITVWAERVPGHRVKLSVRDTGVGISEEDRAKVFSAFERVENEYSKAQVGTGLGMPLTKKLAEVNEGTADFISESGKGSTFWIVMPAAEIDSHKTNIGGEQTASAGIPVSCGHGEKLLVVEGNSDTQQMLERYLVHQGFSVVRAQSGAEVISVLRSNNIELALVDSEISDTGGENIISVIRSAVNGSAVPVILLSSQAFVFDIERFLKLGVDRCLSKPIDLREVAIAVRQLLDESKTTHASSSNV